MRASIVAQPDPQRMPYGITDAISLVRSGEPREAGVITGAQRMADDTAIRGLESQFAGDLPAGHPERLADVGDMGKEALAELAGRLWPHDEYAAIYRERNGGAS